MANLESWLDNTTAKDAVVTPDTDMIFRVIQGGASKKITQSILNTYLSGVLATGLIVGTSAVTGGVDGRILYNNAGVLGELTSTGTGAVARATSPSFTTPNLGAPSAGSLAACTGYTFANLASKPTTLSGFGITDGQPLDADLTAIAALTTTSFGRGVLTWADAAAGRSSLALGSFATISSLAFSSLTGTPTTLSGYGITDSIASLGLNTFTRRQTITQGTANESILASTGYSVTGSGTTSMVDLAGTWNTSGAPTAIKLNITDTASSASSLLLDLQVGGTTQVAFGKSSRIFGTQSTTGGVSISTTATSTSFFDVVGGSVFGYTSGNIGYSLNRSGSNGFDTTSAGRITWSSSSTTAGNPGDTILTRGGAAATLQLGAADKSAGSATAQTLQVQSVSGDGTNTNLAGSDWTFTLSKGTGTGAGGKWVLQGAVTGSSGSTQNSLVRGMDFTPGVSSSAGGTLGIYQTYTDASNYSYLAIGLADSTTFSIRSKFVGTGSVKNLLIGNDGIGNVWNFSSGGHLLWVTDNAYDIGASGATRPRAGYFGASLSVGTVIMMNSGGTLQTTAGGSIGWSVRSNLVSPSDGVVTLYNAAQSDFGRLQFGGATSSFPALKRSGTIIQARLADDSDYAQMAAAYFNSAKAYTVSGLPAGTVGFIARVTDALAPAVGVTVANGGAAAALVWYNGSNYIVIGV